MIQCWLIMKGSMPSMWHTRYLVEAEAKTEVERLEGIRLADNKRIDESPATGHGSCFLNVKDEKPWTHQYREFPQ